MRPLLDPVRRELIYLARDARGLTGYAHEDIVTSALGFVDLSTISGPLWNHATEQFECLTIALETWDEIADQQDEPYDSAVAVEEEVRALHWSEDRWARCQVINQLIDEIIFAGVFSHLPLFVVEPLETVPRDGMDSYNSLFTVGDRALLESISQELAKRVVS